MDFTWAQSIQYRDYRVQHRYGKYQQVCGLPQDYWWEKDMFGTGGYTNASLSGFPSWSNCAPFDLAGRSRPLANAVLATDSGLSQVVMRLKAGGPGRISAGG